MKRVLPLLSAVLICFHFQAYAQSKVYPYRWVFVQCEQFEPGVVEKVRNIARTCAQHGINGILLSGALERLDLDSPYTFKTIAQINRIAESRGIEIIPQIMSVGYNAFMLQHDKNLAEGLPVKDALFIAGAGKARHVPDPPVELVNGGFETCQGGKFQGYSFPYEHQVAWPDTKIFKEGSTSIRFEKFGRENNDGRLVQEISVMPQRLYRISFWVKTEDLDPSNPFGSPEPRTGSRFIQGSTAKTTVK